ncbi:hypothetical protein POPTR_005G068801v4 [Populus trichocarpa]|uniref:Uncharacterized protein n=1 Tax=Populus trichocarpa TaxID=3694 RepID=A0ACC0SY93_POPTR|nr:hypothetical protein POPTR_005G068801v4 [Populus trichocarpa]
MDLVATRSKLQLLIHHQRKPGFHHLRDIPLFLMNLGKQLRLGVMGMMQVFLRMMSNGCGFDYSRSMEHQ